MEESWFKKFLMIGALPTHRMGFFVLILMVFCFVAFAMGYVYYAKSNPLISGIFGTLGFLSMLSGYAVVYWKRSK